MARADRSDGRKRHAGNAFPPHVRERDFLAPGRVDADAIYARDRLPHGSINHVPDGIVWIQHGANCVKYDGPVVLWSIVSLSEGEHVGVAAFERSRITRRVSERGTICVKCRSEFARARHIWVCVANGALEIPPEAVCWGSSYRHQVFCCSSFSEALLILHAEGCGSWQSQFAAFTTSHTLSWTLTART